VRAPIKESSLGHGERATGKIVYGDKNFNDRPGDYGAHEMPPRIHPLKVEACFETHYLFGSDGDAEVLRNAGKFISGMEAPWRERKGKKGEEGEKEEKDEKEEEVEENVGRRGEKSRMFTAHSARAVPSTPRDPSYLIPDFKIRSARLDKLRQA
jgi:hypothetical protein